MMSRTVQSDLSQYGRYGDSMMAHVAPGEAIVPREVMDQNPQLLNAIAQAIRDAGADPSAYIVGHGMKINPETGQPEFFFKKVFKAVKKIAPYAAAAAALYFGGPAVLGSLGGLSGAASSLGSVGQILGGINTARGLFGGGQEQRAPQITIQNGQRYEDGKAAIEPAQAEPFTPTRPGAMERPAGLSELSSYAPEQERSALATQGINQGLGSQEDAYYRNLLQRSLISDGNQVQNTDNKNFLAPIESQYFSKRGYNTSNVMDFLKAIRG
jgi:hypothetical protein